MKLDEPVIFYLKHQVQIEEWHSLIKKVRDAARQFCWTITDDLHDVIAELPGDPHLYRPGKSGEGTRFMLVRDTWELTGKKSPAAGIGLGIDSPFTFRQIYTGVWMHKSVLPAFRPRVPPLKQQYGLQRGSEWPLFKYELPETSDYWTDLDGFRTQLLEVLADRWRQLWQTVDAFLADNRQD